MTDPYPHLTKRRADLVKLLTEAYDLLTEYERTRLLATDPREKLKLNDFIEDIQQLINRLEHKLHVLDRRMGLLGRNDEPQA